MVVVDFTTDTSRITPCRSRAANPDWWHADMDHGASRYADDVAAAKLGCLRCRHRVDCLTTAEGETYGIRGGLTPTEREDWAPGDGDPFDLRDFPQAPHWHAKPWRWKGQRPAVDLRVVFAAAGDIGPGEEQRDVAKRWGVTIDVLRQAIVIRRWAPDLVDDVCAGHVKFRATLEYARAVREFFQPGRPEPLEVAA